MDPTKTLKRLGSIGLTTAVIAGVSPFLGAVAANAAPNPAGAVHLVDPQNNDVVTTQNDGTDTLVHLYADVLQSANNGGNPLITSVTFSAVDLGAAPINANPPAAVPIGSPVQVQSKPAGADSQGYDSYAVTTWKPTAQGDFYQIIAVGNEANSPSTVPADNASPGNPPGGTCNTSTGTTNCSSTIVQYNQTKTGVYVSRPHDNSLFGYYANPKTNGANLNVAGTSTLNGDPVKAGDGTTPGTSVTFDGTSNNWAANVPLANGDTAPTPAKNTSIQSIAAENTANTTFERDGGEAYLQTFAAQPNGFTVDKQTQFGTANGAGKTFVFQSQDQHGNPIGDLPLYLTVTPSSSTPTDTVQVCSTENGATSGAAANCTNSAQKGTTDQVTDPFGRLIVKVSDTQNESVQLNVKTSFGGYQATQPSPGPATPGYNSGVDYSVTATFTTASQNATSGTVTTVTNTGNPNSTLFASQTYGTGSAQAGPTPGLVVALKDANNQPAPGQTVNYQIVRNVVASTAKACNDTQVYPQNFPAAGQALSATSDANGNAYITPPALNCPTESGTDAFTVYLDKNGVPGYQSGTADVLIGNVTLSFGREQIYFVPCDQIPLYVGGPQPACSAQQKAGVDKTLQIYASIVDPATNAPAAIDSRKIDITLSGGTGTAGTDYGFSANNNSGLVPVDKTKGDITTDSSGKATVTVFDNKTETLTVTASDPTLGANPVPSENATDAVAFRSYSAVLNNTATTTGGSPAQGEVSPLTPGNAVGAPGQPLIQGFQFLDQNGAPLANEVIQVTTNKGFFTDLPTLSGLGIAPTGLGSAYYTKLHFDTPITDGQPIKGDLHSDGTTFNVVTDGNGNGYFNLGILTDPHFATDGTASGTVNAQLNGTGSSQTLDSNAVLFSTDGTTGVQALNPGPMKLLEAYVDNNGVQHVLSTAPSGPRATATKNSIPTDEVDSVIQQTDSFGNRVSEPINVSSTGVGQVSQQGVWGAYNNIDGAQDDSVLEQRTVNESTNPASSSPQTGNQTVTFTWNANKTTGLTNTTTNQTGVNVTSQALTQSYTVTWYVRDPSKFKYFHKFTPGTNEPAGTPISESVGVFDNANRPVQGLGLEFIRSGPQGQTQDTGNPFTCNGAISCQNAIFTDQNGVGGFTFISSKTGPYTMTTIVTDLNGNEIGRDHASGKLTGAPSHVNPRRENPTITAIHSGRRGHVTIHVTSHPKVAGASVHYYRITKHGHRRLLGKNHTGSNGKSAMQFKLTPGKTYKFQVKVFTGGRSDLLPGYSGRQNQRVHG